MIVSEQIISVLNYMCEKLGFAIDWTADNMLPYVSELAAKFIKYEIVTSIAMCVLMLITTIIFGILFSKLHPKAKEVYYRDDEAISWFAGFVGIFFGAFFIMSIIVIGCEIFDIITCLTFPEKFIADYAMELL